MKNFGNVSLLLLVLCSIANAEIIGQNWAAGPGKLTLDSKVYCSAEKGVAPDKKPEMDRPGWVRFSRGADGWFSFAVGNGCAMNWLGSRSFPFRQVGSDVLDRSGKKVGTITGHRIVLTGGSDWDNDAKIEKLEFNEDQNGKAHLEVTFQEKHKDGQFKFVGQFKKQRE